MLTNKQAALALIEVAARQGQTDTRVLEVHNHTAEVYALLAIADALETLAKVVAAHE